MKEKQQQYKTDGFTLIELMVTIAVVAILATVAVPGFQNLIRDNRMTAQVNDMVTALHLARSEAIRRRQEVTICHSANGNTCGAAAGWEAGWIVFVDSDNDGTRDTTPAPAEVMLLVHGALSGGNSMGGAGNFANFISYRAIGFSNINGTFTFCDERGAGEATAIIVSNTGRPRISNQAADGVSSLTCPAT